MSDSIVGKNLGNDEPFLLCFQLCSNMQCHLHEKMHSKGINTAMVKVFARIVFVIVHIDGVRGKWYSELFKTLNPEF